MIAVESNNKRIAKNTLFLYIRMAFSMIVSLYTVRVVLRVLGIEDYGIYSAVAGIVSSLTIFTSTLSIASQRFFSVEIGKGDNGTLNRLFNSMVLLYLLVGVFILIIAETIGVWFLNYKMVIPVERMHAASFVLQSTVISFLISIIISPFQAMIIAKEDMKIYSYVGIYDVVIKLLIVYLLQLFAIDKLILYSLLLLGASITVQFLYFIYTISKYKEIKLDLKWEPQTIKSILSFSGWSFVGSLAFLFNTQGLNLMMNVFYGPIVNAAYNIGNSIKHAINQLGINFFLAVRPTLIKEYAAGNHSYVSRLFLFSTKVIFFLLYVLVFPILLETEGILKLWLGEVGDYMIPFVRLMLVWSLILLLSEPMTAIVQAANKVKRYHIMVDLFTLLTLPLSYLTFKLGFSPESAFMISIIIFMLAHGIRLYIVSDVIEVGIWTYFSKIVIRILFAMSVSFGSSYFIRYLHLPDNTVWLFLKIIVEILIAIISCYFLVLNKEDRERVYILIKGFLKQTLRVA